jgi:hypothetical protein
MRHIYEIDNDGRGPNTYQVHLDGKLIAHVAPRTFGELLEYYDLAGLEYKVYTVGEYYRLEA